MDAHGWRLFVHPLFQAQLEKLAKRVERLASRDPDGYVSHPAAKILTTINHYIREAIPRDPNGPEFRQGNTLGPDNRHWFRAKFHGRYRLFYRFSTEQRIIIYVWVNDEGSLRKSGSRTDPYAVFKAMLESGEPLNSFAELRRTSKEMDASEKTTPRPRGPRE
ncbi:MAG TPA: type II toxin-antitoxin system YhaV family toxin [Candidatus Solibacter sp.]|nr:type II toxin-antitoxin system YhaV family toxin [Candidatus Solibacter sp.]